MGGRGYTLLAEESIDFAETILQFSYFVVLSHSMMDEKKECSM